MTTNQTSQHDLDCGFYNDPYFIPVLYFLLSPVALLLNGVAAWVSLHLKSTSTFMVYLRNLVAADLLLALIVPITAASALLGKPNSLKIIACNVSPVFYSTLYTCIALLGLISLDRFFKIMTPQSKWSGNLTLSKLISGLVWVVLFVATALPNIVLSNKSPVNTTERITCMSLKGPAGLEYHESTVIFLNAFFWLVSVVITVCYVCIANKVLQSFRNSGSSNSQGNQKVKLRVFLVVVVFFVSFGPYHIVRVPYTFHQISSSSSSGCSYLRSRFAKRLSLWVAATNICMNPLLYVFLCREFSEKLTSMTKNVFQTFSKSPPAGQKEDTSSQ